MKPVIQEEVTGCGIASVAVLARVTYRHAQTIANRLGIFAADERLWSETHHVRRLLRHFGLRPSPRERAFTTWESLPRLALLAIKWKKIRGRPYWHWVVFHRGETGPVVFDSKCALRRHLRTDFGRMKPKRLIEVRTRA